MDLYRELMRCFSYSDRVTVTSMSAADMLAYGESMKVVSVEPHALGDVVRMSDESAVLATYYRNNVLHLFAMPSLVACAFVSNATVRTEDLRDAETVREGEARPGEGRGVLRLHHQAVGPTGSGALGPATSTSPTKTPTKKARGVTAMSANGLARNYSVLAPHERFPLMVESMARGDEAEADRLEDSCPRRRYELRDREFQDRMSRSNTIALMVCLNLRQGLAQIRAARPDCSGLREVKSLRERLDVPRHHSRALSPNKRDHQTVSGVKSSRTLPPVRHE